LLETVKLSTGSLAVFSPVNLTPEVRERVDSLGGNVKYIAALDLQHHLHISAWKKAYPQAEILAPEGLWEKRNKKPEFKGEEPFQHVFKKGATNAISEEFDAEFETEYVHGHGSRELVFLHHPSRTVIEADMLFNLPANEQYSKTPDAKPVNCLTKMVLPMLSTSVPATGQRRFAWYILSQQDRSAFTASVKRIVRWDFDRIIPCHGDVIEAGGKGVWQDVMAWFLRDETKHV
jgi:glyoxylase-like metal-dependent hydrolase (beta-lactamase superfamily II)